MANPGHDPPTDITVSMDVSQNPGPCRSDSLVGMVKQTDELCRIDSVQIQHDLNPRKNCKLQCNFGGLPSMNNHRINYTSIELRKLNCKKGVNLLFFQHRSIPVITNNRTILHNEQLQQAFNI